MTKPGRRLVVEADGGARGNPGPAAYGAVVRDAVTGDVLVERAERIGHATNNVAEYRGLIAGLEAAREIDPSAQVEARLDSKLVVEQMSGRWKIKHPGLRPLALTAHGVFPQRQVRYTWIPREQNAHADRLLNVALDTAREDPRKVPPREAAAADAAQAQPPAPPGLAAGQGETGADASAGSVQSQRAGGPQAIGWSPDRGKPATLLLLRHGETALTVDKRFSGAGADPGLTPRGRKQSERAGRLLAGYGGVDAVVTSPSRRARDTAAIVAAELGLDLHVEGGFAECDFGEWEGLTFAEVQQRWPTQLAEWLGSTVVASPGGESFDGVTRRVLRARDAVLARYSACTVLIVTHVTPIKTLVRVALGAPPQALYRMELDPGSLTRIDWYDDDVTLLRLFNDTGHLR